MNTQTINLTPPINGVQYGISTELIKEGDFYYLQSVTTKNMILKASESKISSNCKKIICSTNPKDLRFPYLQIVCPTCGKREWGVCSNSWHKNVMPSKEQEVETYYKWVEVSKYGLPTKDGYYPVKREDNLNPLNWYIDIAKWNNKPKLWSRVIEWLAPININPAKYTQEQVIGYQKWWLKQDVEYFDNTELGDVYKDRKGNTVTDVDLFNKYNQSIQPTPKAVRVEMNNDRERNRNEAMGLKDIIYLPDEIKVETSSEYSQGVIKALEVIY